VQKQLDQMRMFWEGDYNSVAFLEAASKEAFHEDLKTLFQHYDTLSLGTVDHRMMPYLMHELGFLISDRHLAALLHKHDDNHDGDASLPELLELIYDDELIGHFKPTARHIQRGLSKEKLSDEGMDIGNVPSTISCASESGATEIEQDVEKGHHRHTISAPQDMASMRSPLLNKKVVKKNLNKKV